MEPSNKDSHEKHCNCQSFRVLTVFPLQPRVEMKLSSSLLLVALILQAVAFLASGMFFATRIAHRTVFLVRGSFLVLLALINVQDLKSIQSSSLRPKSCHIILLKAFHSISAAFFRPFGTRLCEKI